MSSSLFDEVAASKKPTVKRQPIVANQQSSGSLFDEVASTRRTGQMAREPSGKAKQQQSALLRGAVFDTLDAGAQLLEWALPDSAVRFINEKNDKLAGMGLPLEPLGEAGLSGQLEKRQQMGDGPGRLVGNVMSPWNWGAR